MQRADKPLFGSPVYFSMSAEAVHLLAERKTSSATVDQGVTRFDLFPRVRIAVHEVAVPDDLDERRVSRDVLDRAARPNDEV